MPKVTVKKYSTIDEWNRTFFPVYASKAQLENLAGNPLALAEVLAEEALKHATANLTGIKMAQKRIIRETH